MMNLPLPPELSKRPFDYGIELDPVLNHPHRPMPDPSSGDLKLDPEIALRAKGFGLAINFVYSTQTAMNQEYGQGRSSSVRGFVRSFIDGSGNVQIVHGDLDIFYYSKVGTTGGGITTYAATSGHRTRSTLTYDGTKFTEHFPDGMEVQYQTQGIVTNPDKHELVAVRDANGVIQTYTYGSGPEAGLLKSIAVPGGNKVTFNYVPGTPVSLLSYVEDWANRRTTFQYDDASYCTTMISPLGCTTKYIYSTAGGGKTLIHAIEDPRGYRTTYMYDSQNRVVSMAAGTGQWSWSFQTDKTVMTSPSGALTT